LNGLMETFSREQVLEKMRSLQGGRSIREFAASVGMSHTYIADVYTGRRNPGPNILRYLHPRLKAYKTTTIVYVRDIGGKR
jgi:hypothetical protein